MSTETLTLNIPSTLARELKTANQNFLINILERGLKDFKIERALEQYSRGNMSFGAAAEQANVSQSILSKYAYARGIEPSFSAETVDEELTDIL
jgi:predicted HTH domain antitoxin